MFVLSMAVFARCTDDAENGVDIGVICVFARAVGMKMVADQKQFSGVNDSVLKKAVLLKKRAIESTLRDTERLRWCELRKVSVFFSF